MKCRSPQAHQSRSRQPQIVMEDEINASSSWWHGGSQAEWGRLGLHCATDHAIRLQYTWCRRQRREILRCWNSMEMCHSKGRSKHRVHKAKGQRDRGYVEAIEHFSTNVLSLLTGAIAVEFEALNRPVSFFIVRATSPNLGAEAKASLPTPYIKALLPNTMLFSFLYVLRGGTEKRIGYDHHSFCFGIFNDTMLSYIRHARRALHNATHDDGMSSVRWPYASEGHERRGIV